MNCTCTVQDSFGQGVLFHIFPRHLTGKKSDSRLQLSRGCCYILSRPSLCAIRCLCSCDQITIKSFSCRTMSSNRIYIGRLSHRARESDIERFFRGYGRIREIMLKNGYGFVEFDDYRDADDAVHDLSGKDLCGERIVIEIARGTPRGAGGAFVGGYYPPPPPRHRDYGGYGGGDRGGYGHGGGGRRGGGGGGYGPPSHTEYRVIVENLSSRVSWQDLKDYMRQAGEVTFADAHRYRKNEGVVEFVSKSEMEHAIEKLDGTEINGRRIKLSKDNSRKRRNDSRSRSRSRSRGRDRKSRSKSGSRSRSRSGSRGRKRSRSRDDRNGRSRSRSDSGSPAKKKDRSRSRSEDRKSKSEEDHNDQDKADDVPDKEENGDNERKSRSRSRSASPRSDRKESRSRSRSKSRSRSRSRSQS